MAKKPSKRKIPKDPKVPTLATKKMWKHRPGTAKTYSGVVGGPVHAASRKGGTLRMRRRRQK